MTPWVWLIAGGVLVIVEAIIPGVFLLWFGLAALFAGLVAALFDPPWPLTVLVFAAAALGFVLLSLRWRNKTNLERGNDLNQWGRSQIGKIVIVAQGIEHGRGRARVGDALWEVAGPNLPPGTRVKVTAIEGMVLHVEPVDQQ